MSSLASIEGIGPVYAAKLKAANIASLAVLLKKGGDKKGRKKIAEDSGLSEKQILNWVNRADLARIKGVGTQYADLLEYAGVDTVPELAQRKPENLLAKMIEVNNQKNLVRKTPAASLVEGWVSQAKALPRVVNY